MQVSFQKSSKMMKEIKFVLHVDNDNHCIYLAPINMYDSTRRFDLYVD